MYTVNDFVIIDFQVQHGTSQEIPSGSLYGGLKETTANQGIPAPLPCICVLRVDGDTELFTAPWCGEQLELWPLPADEST